MTKRYFRIGKRRTYKERKAARERQELDPETIKQRAEEIWNSGLRSALSLNRWHMPTKKKKDDAQPDLLPPSKG